MHMADALVSPAVGGVMWAASAATAVYCAKKVREEKDTAKVPLMGVLGAFIFAAQMLNFSIPGTGSSGHIGGGLILAILLGPEAAFLVIASVLGVQALFFADGGLLALGCNIFNLGVFPAFIAYPIFKRLLGAEWARGRIFGASVIAAEFGLLLGAAGVVLQTVVSGVSSLPFGAFISVMLPIHAAIGLVEGLVTAAAVLFVRAAQPEILERSTAARPLNGLAMKKLIIGFSAIAIIAAGCLAWFASTDPDGLEWSIARVTGGRAPSLEKKDSLAANAGELRGKSAVLPDYGLKDGEASSSVEGGESAAKGRVVDPGTSLAGLVGAAITLALSAFIGFLLSRRGSA